MYKLMCIAIILTTAFNISTLSETRLRRAINGFDITIMEVPYHVAVISEDIVSGMEISCNGCIISKDFVLTVAHYVCEDQPIPKRKIDPVYIKSGNHYKPNGTRNEILNIVCHPGYTLWHFTEVEFLPLHDIALIQVEQPFNFSAVEYPVPINVLPISDIHYGRTVFSSGWGVIDTKAEEYSNYLRGLETEIVSMETCWQYVEAIRKHRITENAMIGKLCTKPKNRGLLCNGDSGSPVVINGVLVGIFSGTTSKTDIPGCVYHDKWLHLSADVGYYLPWIYNYTTPSVTALVL